MNVTVTRQTGDQFTVQIGGRTRHEVIARPHTLARVQRPGESAEETIGRAFDFLLAREAPESILRRFALEDIARYFPDFWTEMG